MIEKWMKSELNDAVRIADKIIDEPFLDPDDDKVVLARQFMREHDVAELVRSANESESMDALVRLYWRLRSQEIPEDVDTSLDDMYIAALAFAAGKLSRR